MFVDRKVQKLFAFLSASFKTKTGKDKFTDAVKDKFWKKQMSTRELPCYMLSAKEVEAICNKIKEKYV